MWLDAEHGRQPIARLIHFISTQSGGLIGCIGLHFAFRVESRQPINDLAAGVGAACVFKKGLSLKRCGGKGGELGADPVDIKCHTTVIKEPPRCASTGAANCLPVLGLFSRLRHLVNRTWHKIPFTTAVAQDAFHQRDARHYSSPFIVGYWATADHRRLVYQIINRPILQQKGRFFISFQCFEIKDLCLINIGHSVLNYANAYQAFTSTTTRPRTWPLRISLPSCGRSASVASSIIASSLSIGRSFAIRAHAF